MIKLRNGTIEMEGIVSGREEEAENKRYCGERCSWRVGN